MLKKSVFLFLVWWSITFSFVSAHDCALFTETSIKAIENTLFDTTTKGNPALQTLTKEGLHRALINLKSHCCSSNLLNDNPIMTKSCEEDHILIKNRTNFPQSAFLFDHLVDVMMRRLNIDGNYDDVPVDGKAKERRETTNQIGHQRAWALPPALSRTYHDNRERQASLHIPLYNWVSPQEYRQSLEDIEKTRFPFSKYRERNLNTRYSNLCQSAIYLMTLLPIDFQSEEMLLAQRACDNMTQQTIDKEVYLLSNLIIHKSDLLLSQEMKQYADHYLINTRATKLLENLTNALTNLHGVVRMIPKLISQCN